MMDFVTFATANDVVAFTETRDPIELATFAMRHKRLAGLKAQAKGRGEFWANRVGILRMAHDHPATSGRERLVAAMANAGIGAKRIANGYKWSFDDLDLAIMDENDNGHVVVEARPDPRAATGLPEEGAPDEGRTLPMRHVGGEAGRLAMMAALAALARVVGGERDDIESVSITPLAPRCHGRANLRRGRGHFADTGRHLVHLRALNHILALYEPCTQGRSRGECTVAVPRARSATLRAADVLELERSRERLAGLFAATGVPTLAAEIAERPAHGDGVR